MEGLLLREVEGKEEMEGREAKRRERMEGKVPSPYTMNSV